MPKVHFRAQGRIARGYLAVPAEGPGPVTIVVQEWWAVDDHIRSVCDRFAAEGFMALAPDLYGEQTTNQAAEAEQRMMALSTDRARAELRGAAAYLSAHDAFNGAGVAIVGFCLGGALAVWAAATSPGVNAAVTYYDVMPHAKPDFSSIRAPILGHFGMRDESVSIEAAQALEAELRNAGVCARFELYPGAGHAFFDDTDRLGTYDPRAGQRSWESTIAFLHQELWR